MSGARHFAVEAERRKLAALKELRRAREEAATLRRRERPCDVYLCGVCVRERAEQIKAIEDVGNLVLHDGATFLRIDGESCDGCETFGNMYMYRLREGAAPGEPVLGAVGASEAGTLGRAPSGEGRVYTGDAASLTRDRRPWYDYGKDTGPRLRVKGLVDADSLPVVRPEPTPNAVDPREVDELHRQSQEAMAEGDDRKLGKLYEDLLDTLHSESIPTTDEDPIESARRDLRAKDLEAALGAELAELGRGRNWAVGYQLEVSGGGELVLVVGVKDKASGIPWMCTVDQRALYAAVRRSGSEMRAAAREIATHVRAEVDKARAGASVGAN